MQKSFLHFQLSDALSLDAPLLMLDRLTLDTDTQTALGRRCVTMNDPVFQGHFPGHPILPGVLQTAAMAQAARMLHGELFQVPVQSLALTELRRVKFRSPVLPGTQLAIECKVNQVGDDGAVEYAATITANGEAKSSGYLTLQPKQDQWFQPDDIPSTPIPANALSALKLMESLPHRHPFMLVDAASSVGVQEIRGSKLVSGNDPFVHATRGRCFPECLQIEAAAQLGCAALLSLPENKGLLGYFMSIDQARFLRPALPGDILDFQMSCTPHGKFGVGDISIRIGSTEIATSTIKFALVPQN